VCWQQVLGMQRIVAGRQHAPHSPGHGVPGSARGDAACAESSGWVLGWSGDAGHVALHLSSSPPAKSSSLASKTSCSPPGSAGAMARGAARLAASVSVHTGSGRVSASERSSTNTYPQAHLSYWAPAGLSSCPLACFAKSIVGYVAYAARHSCRTQHIVSDTPPVSLQPFVSRTPDTIGAIFRRWCACA